MKLPHFALAAALISTGALTSAQTTPTPSGDTPDPAVAAANQGVATQQAARQDAIAGANADAQAQYDADMAAYRETLRQRHHEAVADARLYDHQQRAYADAMADWRRQVYACKHGSNRACELPTPDPANYW